MSNPGPLRLAMVGSRFLRLIRSLHTTPIKACEGNVVTRASGAYHPIPIRVPLSLSKSTLVLGSGVLVGVWMAKYGAAFLEENDIFVPEDEDDD